MNLFNVIAMIGYKSQAPSVVLEYKRIVERQKVSDKPQSSAVAILYQIKLPLLSIMRRYNRQQVRRNISYSDSSTSYTKKCVGSKNRF